MTDPSYRETPEASPQFGRLLFGACANRSHPPGTIAHHAAVEDDCTCACHVANPVRPLPDWMPTPDDLDALSESSAPMAHKDQCRLLRAVRWLLEERENGSQRV